MMEKGMDRQDDLKVLLKQHALRQAAANKQVLQAMHQANEALQQARQLIISEMEFQQQLAELAGFNKMTQTDVHGEQFQQVEPLIPWRLGQPPHLQ